MERNSFWKSSSLHPSSRTRGQRGPVPSSITSAPPMAESQRSGCGDPVLGCSTGEASERKCTSNKRYQEWGTHPGGGRSMVARGPGPAGRTIVCGLSQLAPHCGEPCLAKKLALVCAHRIRQVLPMLGLLEACCGKLCVCACTHAVERGERGTEAGLEGGFRSFKPEGISSLETRI